MILAETNWLSISINLLLVVHVVVCLFLGLVVLMQRPKQEGLGAAFGANLTDQAFGARTTDVLQKATVWFGIAFFAITLVLAVLQSKVGNSGPSAQVEVAVEAPLAEEAQIVTPSSVDAEQVAEIVEENAEAPATDAAVEQAVEKIEAAAAEEGAAAQQAVEEVAEAKEEVKEVAEAAAEQADAEVKEAVEAVAPAVPAEAPKSE